MWAATALRWWRPSSRQSRTKTRSSKICSHTSGEGPPMLDSLISPWVLHLWLLLIICGLIYFSLFLSATVLVMHICSTFFFVPISRNLYVFSGQVKAESTGKERCFPTPVSIHMKMQITVSSAAKAKGDTITPIHRFMLTSQKPANNNTVHTFDIARKVFMFLAHK